MTQKASQNASSLPAMRMFRDIPVLHTTAALRTVYNGGPVWPRPDDVDWLWHRRADQKMDVPPIPVKKDMPRREGVFIWGGQVHRQFGHQVAEYSTRVLQSLRDVPTGKLLFTLWPGGVASEVPGHFWAIMDWYGVPRDRVEIVTRDFVAAELWVAPQPEQLGGPGPVPEYLTLLAEVERRHGLTPAQNGTIYVSREKMLLRCLGTWAGEGYLSARLAERGVRVIRPEEMALRDQLEAYASARLAIFADGSALHGRQLLGYHPQTIAVVTRRPIGRLAEHMIAPRCDDLRYICRPRGSLHLVIAGGRPDTDRALSLYQEADILPSFNDLGIDLAPVWNPKAFKAACDADIGSWLARTFSPQRQANPGFDWPASYLQVREDLARLGLDHLLPLAEAHARPPSGRVRLARSLRHRAGPAYHRLRAWLRGAN